MTRITIGERVITTRPATDASPQLALDRILRRAYGAGSFMRSRNQERWRDGGQTFQGYCDIYKPWSSGQSDHSSSLVAEHVWIVVE